MSALPELPSCADSPKQRMVSFADCMDYGDARAAHARKLALEESAEYVDRNLMSCRDYADAIRSLK